MALCGELVKFKRVDFVRDLLVAVVEREIVACKKQVPEAHVARALGVHGIDAEVAPDLPREEAAQVRGACRCAAGTAKLDFFVGEYVKNSAGVRPA